MSGVNTIAKNLVSDAMELSEQDPSMDADAMGHAILSQILMTLSKSRTRKDIENYIEYDLDNQVDSDIVITRGC